MTFSLFQSSRSKSTPANLYFFRYGALPSSYFAYTDAEQPITITQADFEDPMTDPITYTPVPIDRSDYGLSGTLDKTAMTIMCPSSLGIAEIFRVYPPSYVVNVVCREIELNDPDQEAKVYWTGRVLSNARADNQVKLTCEPISTSARRNGLIRNYQYSCPLVLYGRLCKADKAAATVVAATESIGNTTVTMPVGWSDTAHAALYVGGVAQWPGANGEPVIRNIIQQSIGRVFTLAGTTTDLTAGENVTLVRGCTHDMAGCNSHNNIQNYGGCPFIPLVNPLSFHNNFY